MAKTIKDFAKANPEVAVRLARPRVALEDVLADCLGKKRIKDFLEKLDRNGFKIVRNRVRYAEDPQLPKSKARR